MLLEILFDVLFVQNVGDECHCYKRLRELSKPFGLLLFRNFEQVSNERIKESKFF